MFLVDNERGNPFLLRESFLREPGCGRALISPGGWQSLPIKGVISTGLATRGSTPRGSGGNPFLLRESFLRRKRKCCRSEGT